MTTENYAPGGLEHLPPKSKDDGGPCGMCRKLTVLIAQLRDTTSKMEDYLCRDGTLPERGTQKRDVYDALKQDQQTILKALMSIKPV